MEKIKINYFVDLALLIAFLLVLVTGILKFPGLLKSLGVNMKMFNWFVISKIHDWAGVALFVFVLLHFVLHWKWLFSMTKSYILGKK